ncbi:hypothetical protein [Leptospira sp. GIMC2001]|uniref:hypothetical protein n=1 Tax=Leptospira sp. GIMC2001 TaxID=1513297 RepID=UPI00234B032B|nr:hypothetical protein [Leptospira sp. GIMC2001]WCL50553.1 hypothetical protein O4O04_06970 [Leptospira sp. GIMC2001]
MKLIEYFKIKIKKPILSQEEMVKENQKKKYYTQLEQASSRLESIEILVANNKNNDSFILGTHLAVDIFNLFANYYKMKNLFTIEEVKASIGSFSDSKVKDLFEKCEFITNYKPNIDPTDEYCEAMETSVSGLLHGTEKFFKHINRTDLFTPMDEFNRRWKTQSSIAVFIAVFIFGSLVIDAISKPTIHKDVAQFYYTTEPNTNFTEEQSVRTPLEMIDKGQWKEIAFDIPEGTKPFQLIRFDPLTQVKAKFTLAEVKYLSANGKIIFQRDFSLTENLFPANTSQLGDFHDFKPGKNKVGGFMEMVTTGTDPYITFDLPSKIAVAKVIFKIRVLEDFKKFEE